MLRIIGHGGRISCFLFVAEMSSAIGKSQDLKTYDNMKQISMTGVNL